MMSQESEFEFVDRGFKDVIALIPGWATDHRVFSTLNLDYNYIIAKRFNPIDFCDRLLVVLNKKSVGGVSLFGWSLGAFLAVQFALRNPDRTREVILLGIRDQYEPAAIQEIKQKIAKNKKAFLFKFYHECFSGINDESQMLFKKDLLKDYLDTMRNDDLMTGLDYLSKARMNTESLKLIKKIRIFHGLEDKIAPVNRVKEMEKLLPEVKFVFIPDAGHAVFLTRGFTERLNNG